MKIITTNYKEGKFWEESTAEFKEAGCMNVVNIYPDCAKQEMKGFGGGFTETAGYVYSKLSDENKEAFLNAYFTEEGLNYTIGRTHMNSCDFSLSNYAAVTDEKDVEFQSFTFEREEKYLFPLISAAYAKRGEAIGLLLSPWSPPAFMKTNGEMNNGGKLKDEYYSSWALYEAKYIKELMKRGFKIEYLSVQNEPEATQTWDSCRYSAKQEAGYVKDYLKKALDDAGLSDIKIIIWDHNKEIAYERAKEIYSDQDVYDRVYGMGIHWYTGDHFETLKLIREKYPDKEIFFTEGCVEYITALLLAGMMAVSLVGCGGNSGSGSTTPEPEASTDAAATDNASEDAGTEEAATNLEGKLVIWTLAKDLEDFGKHFQEMNPGVEVETVIIAPADYPTKLSAALRGRAKEPDIIVGEPQMLPEFIEAGYFENLSQDPYGADQYKDKLVDYIFEAGRGDDGNVYALSYQVTPVGVYYRRDIAQDVFGTDDPAVISEKFDSYETIQKTAEEVRNKGYRIFSDTGSLRWFANGGGAWVQDGKLVLSDERIAYMDAAVKLFQDGHVAFAPEWSAAWYKSMSGEVPVNAEWASEEELESLTAEKTEVFAFVLPSWGSLIVRDNAGDNAGSFGVAEGPCVGFGGGTFVGISAHSERKELAWEFVKFATLNEDTSQWWSDFSKGDIVSMKSVLEGLKDTKNETYGGQSTYAYFYEQAEGIDYSLITRYDTACTDYWGAAIESVQKGEKTKEDAISEFYKNVSSVYPELEIPQ